MTDLINMANWGGAQWVLLFLMLLGLLMKTQEYDFWASVIGAFITLGLLTWGGFWA